jgi:dTDP-4-dehydrorhamnose reductase
MARCLILGAYGLLGSSLSLYLQQVGHTVLRHGRRSDAQIHLDFSSSLEISKFYESEKIEVIINLVAETNVDKCEIDFESALQANMVFLSGLVDSIQKCSNGSPPYLIHLSSDQVYSGFGPHTEENPSPINIYGLSKLGGEMLAQKTDATILRTNFIGRSHSIGRGGLADWILNSLKSGNKITVFKDVLFNPLHISTLCKLIELVIQVRKKGVYNLSSSEGNSKAYLATCLAQKLHLNMDLISVDNYKQVSQFAMRPLDMRLNSKKFEKDFGVVLPTFNEQIELTAKEY